MARTCIYRTKHGALGQTVAVIASDADLLKAKRIATVDFFELRLDALAPILDRVDREIQGLKPPLIVTARHPHEGGAHHLTATRRAELLLRFLKDAAFVDLELRSLGQLRIVQQRARAQNVHFILSVHDLRDTPPLAALRRKAHRAAKAGADIFKIVTRTDTPEQIDRLFDFFDAPDVDLPISAMGLGKFGRLTRLELAARGSVLNYAHLGRAQVPGQFSLAAWKGVVRYLRRAPR